MNKTLSLEPLFNFGNSYGRRYVEEIHGKNVPHKRDTYVVLALWFRLTELHNGVISLAQNRLSTNGFILLRSMCETAIILRKITRDSEFATIYFNKVQREKHKSLDRISKVLDKTSFTLTQEEISQFKETISSKINKESAADYRVKDLFYNEGQFTLYEMVYAHCCTFAHSEASILERYIVEREGKYELCPNKSLFEDAVFTCLMSTSLLTQGFTEMCSYIEYKPKSNEKFFDEYQDIQKFYH
ncbi:MAG: DUF5677 domain-containing protein [Bacteriovoracaceae bacterium]